MELGRILVYPIKSLDGVEVEAGRIAAGGGLVHDRTYALFDAADRVVNGKRDARLQRVRSAFSGDFAEVELWAEDEPRRARFALAEPAPVERWFGEFLGFPVRLRRDATTGFPDDLKAPGPTVTSEASLEALATWFPGTGAPNLRARFRSNLELAGGEPFAEDALYGAAGERRAFRVGGVAFFGTNPCQRCAVPGRDPRTGSTDAGFQKHFMARREASLPSWAERARFNHFYRFAVNTIVPASEVGKELRVGDPLVR